MKQDHRRLAIEELAFFWNPRAWPAIVARFGEGHGGSHADVREAIIEVDDDGGAGFLHWHADRKSWCLTDKGKTYVKRLLSPAKLEAEKTWEPPSTILRAAEASVKANEIKEYE